MWVSENVRRQSEANLKATASNDSSVRGTRECVTQPEDPSLDARCTLARVVHLAGAIENTELEGYASNVNIVQTSSSLAHTLGWEKGVAATEPVRVVWHGVRQP